MSEPSKKEEKHVRRLKGSDYAIAGAVSGIVSRFLVQPLDVLKIRFQLQVKQKGKDVKYKGIFQATQRIIREEGVPALFKGHIPAQLLSFIYGTVQFPVFELATKAVPPEHRHSAIVHFLAGTFAGTVAEIISFPCDVLRTRLVVQGEPKVYNGIFDGTKKILKQEGPSAFYKGFLPTVLQIAPSTGIQFACYHLFKNIWRFIFGGEVVESSSIIVPASLTGSLVSGSLSGACSKIIVYPLDLVRRRLQVQGFESGTSQSGGVLRCSGMMDCLMKTIKEEKFIGLYKGLSTSMVKSAFGSGICFCAYEQTCRVLEKWT